MKQLLFLLIILSISPIISYTQNADSSRYPVKRLEYGWRVGPAYFYPLGDRKFDLFYSSSLESKYVYRPSFYNTFEYAATYEFHNGISHRKLRYYLHYVGVSGMYYYGGFWFLEYFFRKLWKVLHVKRTDKSPILVGLGIGPYFKYLIRGREGGKPIKHANLNRFDPGIAIGFSLTIPPSYYDNTMIYHLVPSTIKLQIGFRRVLDFRLNYLSMGIINLSFKTNL